MIAINETLLPPESTAFQLGEMLIDAINYEKSLVDKKNQVVDEAPPVNVPEPNPVSSSAETGKCSTVMWSCADHTRYYTIHLDNIMYTYGKFT